ncbi:MAG TPA: hypothetical protein PLX35_13920 [Cyclobacteriaceae bacterium]|nr:hypothetical protein [Cyclobacteriaceae bacterium]
MKKLKLILVLVLSLAVVISCTDNSLDPLQFSNMKKGTILALRGTQLTNLYNKGIPGATLVPKTMSGTEVFTFDTELLASNPADLASVDVYVIKGAGTNTTRQLLKNVPASAFKKDATYLGPWTTISITIAETCTALGLLPPTDPSYKLDSNPLNNLYKNGVNFECDINLTNGTKINASDIIASGLFQSNQFYPAMKLTWTMLKYCDYVEDSWTGKWVGTEAGSCCSGDDVNNIVKIAPNTFQMDDFWGYKEAGPGYTPVSAVVVFTPSTNLNNQIMTFPAQNVVDPNDGNDGKEKILASPGTYDQCKNIWSSKVTYVFGGTNYTWVYSFRKK